MPVPSTRAAGRSSPPAGQASACSTSNTAPSRSTSPASKSTPVIKAAASVPIPAAGALQPGRATAALPPGGSRSASAGGERVVDVEVVGGAVRGDGHAVPGQQRVVVDDREVGRGEADLVAEQGRAGLGPVEGMSVAGAQGRGGGGLADPAE